MSDIAVIIGLGYVGLPLAREAARSGLKVIGLDLNEEIVSPALRRVAPILTT